MSSGVVYLIWLGVVADSIAQLENHIVPVIPFGVLTIDSRYHIVVDLLTSAVNISRVGQQGSTRVFLSRRKLQ